LPDKLIIFDYSGTLSPAMAAFGASDNLACYLKESGLQEIGIKDNNHFWNVVNEIWPEGSLTKAGYAGTLQNHLFKLFPATGKMKIKNAVDSFAAAYFSTSVIDDGWRNTLEKLSRDENSLVVIATDSYAETTKTIIRNLSQWRIKAVRVGAKTASNFIVANSADIGADKKDRLFWNKIRTVCPAGIKKILLIDDFGAAEPQGDAYGQKKKIAERRKKTVALLTAVFGVPVRLAPAANLTSKNFVSLLF